MLRDMLTLTTVKVEKVVEAGNGMGALSATTTLTTLSYAAIYQSGSFNRFMSDRVNRDSTHVLVTEPGFYAWTQADRFVSYDGDTYKIVGRPDDVMFKEEVLVVPLELLS